MIDLFLLGQHQKSLVKSISQNSSQAIQAGLWARAFPSNALSILVASVWLGFLPSTVFANGNALQCPVAWSNIVAAVQELASEYENSHPVVFIERNGSVYDCLNRNVSESDIETIRIVENSLPIHSSGLDLDRPETWPVDFCNAGRWDLAGLDYYAISMPEIESISRDNRCVNRITSAFERLIQSERN